MEFQRTVLVLKMVLYNAYLPFFFLPLYTTLVKVDIRLLEAAYDLGARPWRAFLAVTRPLSMPGVSAGSMLVFIPSVGEYVIPEMLGGANTLMMGRVMWTEFFNNADWRSEEHTSELQSLMRISYAVF